MLRNEHGMPAHRRLLTIIFGPGGSKPARDKIRRMLVDSLRPFVITVLPFFYAQMKTAAKR